MLKHSYVFQEGQTKGWGAPFGAAVAGVVAPALAAPVAHAVAPVAHAVAPVAHAVAPAVAVAPALSHVARPWGAAYGYGVAHPAYYGGAYHGYHGYGHY